MPNLRIPIWGSQLLGFPNWLGLSRLLTNVPFLLLCLCNLFSTQGLYIPYVYLVELATSEGNRVLWCPKFQIPNMPFQNQIHPYTRPPMSTSPSSSQSSYWSWSSSYLSWSGVTASSAAFLISVVGFQLLQFCQLLPFIPFRLFSGIDLLPKDNIPLKDYLQVGISNTIGRVISGAFTDLPFVRW